MSASRTEGSGLQDDRTGGPGHAEGRSDPIRRRIHPGTRGIEIGPWRNPIAAKRDGHDTIVVDRYDEATLREMARKRGIPEDQVGRIEAVDIVGDASRLFDLVRGSGFTGQVDWIVSSHNLEHLPDPLRFLQDCERLLTPDGLLAMIVPDKRCCMDRFQPAATVAGILRAATEAPSLAAEAWAAFAQGSMGTRIHRDGTEGTAWALAEGDPSHLRLCDPRGPQDQMRRQLEGRRDPGFSGHRWRYTPAVLEAILFDLRVLGMTTLVPEEVTATVGYEFMVFLRPAPPLTWTPEEIRARRTALYVRAEDEAAVVSRAYRELVGELDRARSELTRLAARPT